MASKVYPGAGEIGTPIKATSTVTAPKKHDPMNQPSTLTEGGQGEIVSN